MSSYLKHYSVHHELNTLVACWIAVDVWSNSSRWRKYRSTCLGQDAYMYDHCFRYRHDFARFYKLLDSNLFIHDTSILHHAFMLIFIVFWAVILLVVPYLCLFSLILQGLFEEGEFRQLEF